MSQQSLEDVLQSAGSPVQLLRNSQIGPYAFPVVPSEFTNWRDEQRSWRETCALFDQSHHMTDLYLEGPDALKLLSDLGVNSFKNFKVNQAKQFVACNHDGYVIGDAILFYLADNRLSLVGPALPRSTGSSTTRRPAVPGQRRTRRAIRGQSWVAQAVPIPGAGATRVEGHGEGDRQARARHPILQHGRHHHRRIRSSRLASRHGGPAGMGALRSVGAGGRGPRRDPRSRP